MSEPEVPYTPETQVVVYNQTDCEILHDSIWAIKPICCNTTEFDFKDPDARGIVCDDKKRVTMVMLDSKNYKGEIPPEIHKLDEMVTFNLRKNRISGIVPANLCLLPKIKIINLGRNQLSGPLPSNFVILNNILEFFSIYANTEMTGSFDQMMCNMTNLKTIYIGGTRFNGTLPDCLTKMINLEKLDVGDSFYTGLIPENIGDLKNLKELYLNELTSTNNFLGPLPESFGLLPNLRSLYMASANLSGPLPVIKFQLTEQCYLEPPASTLCRPTDWLEPGGSCDWSVLKQCPDNCMVLYGWLNFDARDCCNNPAVTCDVHKRVRTLDLSGTSYSGPVPAAIGTFKELQELNLSNSNFSGQLPDTISTIYTLESLDISNSGFTGYFPDTSLLDSLRILDVSGMQLNGSVPYLIKQQLDSFVAVGSSIGVADENPIALPSPTPSSAVPSASAHSSMLLLLVLVVMLF